jgi:uncharacterized protein (DUF1697 family)
MTACVALIRGINVGRAKRIAMAQLRDMVEGLGHENVRTLLNSGNVVFDARRAHTGKIALALRKGIEERFGICAHVVVVTAAELRAAIDENPCMVEDPSRFLVAFVGDTSVLGSAAGLVGKAWAPETLAIGKRAAYIGCPNGIHDSKLMQAFSRATGESCTARNWSTVLKLSEAAAR